MPFNTEDKINIGAISSNRCVIFLELNVGIDLHLRGKHSRIIVSMKDMIVLACARDAFDLLKVVFEARLAQLEDRIEVLCCRFRGKALDCLQRLGDHLIAA